MNSDVDKDELKDERVIGGRDALMGECPYQIALMANDRFICGGFFIHQSAIVTAAHCVSGPGNTVYKVRYNTLTHKTGSLIEVRRAIPHPNYNPRTNANDIAVLILSAPFSFGENANIIDISRSMDPRPNSIVTVSGWGRISTSSYEVSETLKVANLSVISRRQCSDIWSPITVTNGMICAMDKYRSACNGDSGGPLVQNGVIVGVVSFGSSRCLHDRLPNVYTRVSTYANWIRSVVYFAINL
ncbi:mite allergen Der p 3-like [Oppia nitens]|uniref:mite allergen Der p 3-like n=1 Tax=Oppia nitens TaxID=1686743 RepID=UPI0023DB45F2|nr:mite allergen Der p 3-like [Oppia nitens]